MNDQLGIFGRGDGETGELDVDELKAALAATPPEDSIDSEPPPSRPEREVDSRKAVRRHRRWVVFSVVVLVVIVAGLISGFVLWRSTADIVPDFAGPGGDEVVIRVQGGDDISDIARTLTDAGVVAGPEAFEQQAALDADVQALRPGYYKVRQRASAQATADALVAKGSRVGQVRLIPGRQLADVTAVSTDPAAPATVVPGYITQITEAACVPLNSKQDCFPADELWKVAETADPAELGVIEWADEDVRTAPDPRKRLEGMMLPGDFDIPPGSTPEQALKAVLSASAALWNGTDIIAEAAARKITPYQAAIIASLVEREGIVADMPKVSRVVYNRLAKAMKLEFDSTVNYALDRASIATSAKDRATKSPYNTYVHKGLPPTPISSPGPDAVAAALDPAEGPWLFFVKQNAKGESCFSITAKQHEACVAKARAAGVFG